MKLTGTLFSRIRNRWSSRDFFFLCVILPGLISVLYIMIVGDASDQWFLFPDKDDSFMDFFHPISHAYQLNPYTSVDRIYPAFCYILYWAVSKIISFSVLSEGNGFTIRACRDGLFAFALCSSLTMAAFSVALSKLHKGGKLEKVIF